MKGTVKFWNSDKGFGFIVGEDGKEYFVHVSELPKSSPSLLENQAVSFEDAEGDRGPVAKSIILEVE